MQNKAGEERNIAVDVDGQELEQVRDFTYLGQIITDDGRCDKEVKRRIAIARSNFINMKDVLPTRKLKWDTRMRLVRCYILSTLLYASETLVLNTEIEGRVRSLEMWIYRRMLKISYQQHISNSGSGWCSNRSLYDTNLKFGTMIEYNQTNIFRYRATADSSCKQNGNGHHRFLFSTYLSL